MKNKLQHLLGAIAEKLNPLKLLKSIGNYTKQYVSGQFGRMEEQSIFVGSYGLRIIPYYDENAERSLKLAKEKTMTYIIAGILNKKPFLMSDCVAVDKTTGVRQFRYTNKLNKLISCNSETYFCIAGNDAYVYAINCFDKERYQKNESFDFKNEDQIKNILEIYERIKEYRKNLGYPIDDYARLYFIDKSDVYYYDIDDDGIISKRQSIKNDNYYIKPDMSKNPPVKLDVSFKDNPELLLYCKDKILECSISNYNIDLKDRYSYIIFDKNKSIYDNSIKNIDELSLALIGGLYDELK